jgi:hypothetical protein
MRFAIKNNGNANLSERRSRDDDGNNNDGQAANVNQRPPVSLSACPKIAFSLTLLFRSSQTKRSDLPHFEEDHDSNSPR